MIIVIFGIIAVVGLLEYFIYADYESKYQFNETTGGSFENQWIKFEYPPNLIVQDASTNNSILIFIYNGSVNDSNEIGEIHNNNINITYILDSAPEYNQSYKKITIVGREALISNFTLNGIDGKRPISDISLSNSSILSVSFHQEYESAFYQVLNSLIIKKTI